MQVGFVGLGVMGLPMVRNLLEKGHVVTVSNRSRGPVEAAVALGAKDGGDPAGVAAASEVVVLCVPNSPQVVEVVDRLLPGLSAGTVVVDCSTIDPDVEVEQHQRVAAAGARYLDAPVSGGSVGAQNGTLTLMVGGEADVLEAARPALDAFSRLVVHVGPAGMGQVVKLCNNLVYGAQMQAVAEAAVLAERSGADLAKTFEVMTNGTGDCVAVRTRWPVPGVVPESPASNGWQPGFMTDLMAKDLDLALAFAARKSVPLHCVEVAREALRSASAAGHGRDDFSRVVEVVRERARE